MRTRNVDHGNAIFFILNELQDDNGILDSSPLLPNSDTIQEILRYSIC